MEKIAAENWNILKFSTFRPFLTIKIQKEGTRSVLLLLDSFRTHAVVPWALVVRVQCGRTMRREKDICFFKSNSQHFRPLKKQKWRKTKNYSKKLLLRQRLSEAFQQGANQLALKKHDLECWDLSLVWAFFVYPRASRFQQNE